MHLHHWLRNKKQLFLVSSTISKLHSTLHSASLPLMATDLISNSPRLRIVFITNQSADIILSELFKMRTVTNFWKIPIAVQDIFKLLILADQQFQKESHINSNLCSCENYVSSTENLCFFTIWQKWWTTAKWWEDSRLLFLNKTMAVSNAISFIFCELSAPSLASRLICGLLLQQMAAKSVAHVNLQGQSIPLHSFTVGAVRNECALEFLYHTILMFLPNFHALVAFLLSSTPLFLSHLLHYSTICCSCSLDIFSQHKCA